MSQTEWKKIYEPCFYNGLNSIANCPTNWAWSIKVIMNYYRDEYCIFQVAMTSENVDIRNSFNFNSFVHAYISFTFPIIHFSLWFPRLQQQAATFLIYLKRTLIFSNNLKTKLLTGSLHILPRARVPQGDKILHRFITNPSRRLFPP